MKLKNASWGLGVALLSLAAPALVHGAETTETKPKKATTAKSATKKTRKTPAARGTAYIRVLHAIPDGPQVDVYVSGQKALSNVAFKTLSDYIPVPSGKREFKITAAGKTDALLSASKAVTKDKYFTVIAMGTAAKPTLIFQNESTGKDMAGKARIRIYHLAPDAPNVNVTTPSTRGKDGYATLAKNLAYGKSMSKTVAPMTATLQVRTSDGKIVKEITGVKLEAGKRYGAFAVGTVGATGAQAFDVVVAQAASK